MVSGLDGEILILMPSVSPSNHHWKEGVSQSYFSDFLAQRHRRSSQPHSKACSKRIKTYHITPKMNQLRRHVREARVGRRCYVMASSLAILHTARRPTTAKFGMIITHVRHNSYDHSVKELDYRTERGCHQ